MEPAYVALPEPPPYQASDSNKKPNERDSLDKLVDGMAITWSLVIHCLGSLGIAAFVLWLDQRHFNIEREQEVPLVDGRTTSLNISWYHAPLKVQPDVTTVISALLKLLGLVADGWAGALRRRIIMLLGEKSRDGLNRREINLISKYGVLPPKSHFQLSLNPILGIILIVTLARNVASPILTGSVAWIPSSSVLKLGHPPTIPITGVDASSGTSFDEVNTAAIPVNLASILNTAWGTDIEDGGFKRVVPSTRHLNIGSIVKNVTMPYISITNITWLPLNASIDLAGRFESMINNKTFPHLNEQMSQSRAIALLTSTNATWRDVGLQGTHGDVVIITKRSNSSSQVLFQNGNNTWNVSGCFALANVSFIAGSGYCKSCRITSNFTVQNIAELEMREDSYISVTRALNHMPVYVPSLAPLLGSFPDPMAPNVTIDDYVRAFLVRSYSALWNAWTDAPDPYAYGASYQVQVVEQTFTPGAKRLSKRDASEILKSECEPAFPTLQARIDKSRVFWCLGIQLMVTFTGLVFLWLQAGSDTSLITDTSMVGFDIDGNEAPGPEREKFKDTLKSTFESVFKIFCKASKERKPEPSEVMLRAIYEPGREVWGVVPVQSQGDCDKLD